MSNLVILVEFKKNWRLISCHTEPDNFYESIAIGRTHHNCPLLLIFLYRKHQNKRSGRRKEEREKVKGGSRKEEGRKE